MGYSPLWWETTTVANSTASNSTRVTGYVHILWIIYECCTEFFDQCWWRQISYKDCTLQNLLQHLIKKLPGSPYENSGCPTSLCNPLFIQHTIYIPHNCSKTTSNTLLAGGSGSHRNMGGGGSGGGGLITKKARNHQQQPHGQQKKLLVQKHNFDQTLKELSSKWQNLLILSFKKIVALLSLKPLTISALMGLFWKLHQGRWHNLQPKYQWQNPWCWCSVVFLKCLQHQIPELHIQASNCDLVLRLSVSEQNFTHQVVHNYL